MKPRTIYANRIAYLIATKRNTLKRLALMGAANTERRIKSANKMGGRKLQRSSVRITRKGNGKRAGRSNNVMVDCFVVIDNNFYEFSASVLFLEC